MLRRLIIATGTLGLILIGFGIYRSHNLAPERVLPPIPELTLTPMSAPASQREIPGIKNLQIAPGKEATFEFFDPKGQLQYMMKAAEWKAESQNELSLNKPELWKFMRNGQILRITADSGQISIEQSGKSNIKPKRGWLRNNVRIAIDMTTRQWRQQHPGRDAIEQHPDRVVFIEMDSLYFDDDLSLIRTDEAIRVRAARFDITSTGLKLIYSRPMDRLEQLTLAKDGKIILRGDLDFGDTPARTGSTPPRAASAHKALASAPATEAAASGPASAPSSRPAPAKFQDIYKAVFEGPINIQQYREDKLVATLDSDKLLELVFDMAQEERAAGEPRDKTLPAMGPAEQPVEQTAGRTELTWAGSLEITPIERNLIEHPKRTTRIRAAGDKVVLADKEEGNLITCQQLDYDAVSQSGRITAQAPALARLTDSRGGTLEGQDIHFDRTGLIMDIEGPGRATEPAATTAAAAAGGSGDGPTTIQWSTQLTVRFLRTSMPMPRSIIPLDLPKSAAMARLNTQTIFEMRKPVRRADPLAGNPLRGLMAESAVIAGDALVQRGRETIRAEKLAIAFFPADAKGKTFGPIQSAIGEGAVQLAAREQKIEADSLDMHFMPTGAGRSTPNRAIAQGHAVASQGKSRIAADFLDAMLAEVPAEPSHADQGDDAIKTKPAVVSLTASGNVRITDPEQNLDLVGNTLTAAIPDGRQVRDVVIKGTPAAPASIAMKDYKLVGPSIQADLQSQNITVPSAGSLEMLVQQGPEGTPLDKPRPLVISWSDRMRMWGTQNQALFEGNVQALMASNDQGGEDTAVTADRMTVYFRAIGQADEPAEPPAASQPSPILKILDRTRAEIAEVMPAAAEWLPQTRSGSRAKRPGSDFGAVRREPVKILAEGNAKAVSSRYDATGKFLTSRLLVKGATFVADLGREQMEVPGKGELLIENYAIAKAAARLADGQNPATLPALKGISEDNLSQTGFTWTSGMTFSLTEQLAVFDGTVNMVHCSGSKVALGAQLAQALGAKPALLQVMPGRLAKLNCDNLVVQFRPAPDKQPKHGEVADPWLRRAQLENMIATGSVYLNEEFSNGGSNFLVAGRVQYSGQRDTFVIQGSPNAMAKLVRQKDGQSVPESTSMVAFWWNRRTDEVSVRGVRGQSMR